MVCQLYLPDYVNAVLLLTYGEAKEGMTDRQSIQKFLQTLLEVGPPLKLHTFEYGDDHNGELLKTLAATGQGNYYSIEYDRDVPAYFLDALCGLASLTAKNVFLEISTVQPDVVLEEVFAEMKEIEDFFFLPKARRKMHLPDLYSEERKDVLVRLKIPAPKTPVEVQELLRVHLSYLNVPGAELVRKESVVCVKRSSAVLKNRPAEELLEQRLRVNVADVLSSVVLAIEGRDLLETRRTLADQVATVETHKDALYKRLALNDLALAEEVISVKEVCNENPYTRLQRVFLEARESHQQTLVCCQSPRDATLFTDVENKCSQDSCGLRFEKNELVKPVGQT